MNRGYVKIYRKSLDAGWLKNHKLWVFWTWCLLKAAHCEYDAIVGLQRVHLMPGQFIFGRRVAAGETGLTEREIRTILEFLKKSGNLTIKTTNKFSVITIVNWRTYQDAKDVNGQQNDQQVSNKWPHTRIKEFKNIEEPAPEPPTDEPTAPGFDRIPDLTVRASLEKICLEISRPNQEGKILFQRAHEFVNAMLKASLRPEAILRALEKLRSAGPVRSPWAYAQQVAEIESKNLNERDAIREHEALKKADPLKAYLSGGKRLA